MDGRQTRDMMNEADFARLKDRVLERFPISFIVTNPQVEDNPIIYVNRAFEILTGYSARTAIGRNCRFLQGKDTDPSAIQGLRDAIAEGRRHEARLINYRADGSRFTNALVIEPIHDDEGKVKAFLGVQRLVDEGTDTPDATEQLREIQHRVKNHLQMVVSMIRLQSQHAGDGNPAIDYQNLAYRVETLQLLYQEMMHGASEASIPLGAFISRVATTIGHLEGRENIRLNIDTDSFEVPIDTAARIGLLASEIITNAYQHAFEDRSAGLVQVRVKQLSGGIVRLDVMDDGTGLPKELDWPNGNTMGATIVRALLKGIAGSMNVARGVAGTTFSVDVPLSNARETHAN